MAAAQIAGGSAGGEDEAGGVAAYRVAQRGARSDVAAETAEGLGERAFEHIDAPHRALLLGLAAAARPVHADRVHLVGIGHGPVTLGEVADAVDRRHVAVHGIERLEHDQLGPLRIGRPQ